MITQDVVSVMQRKECDEQSLFLAATVYVYGSSDDVSNDVAQFKLNAIVPFYVRKYVEAFLEADI